MLQMQTFLALLLKISGTKISPYRLQKYFRRCARILDNKRLGKQRVEAYQILKTINNGGKWSNHPAVKQWKGFEKCLMLYINAHIDVWISRGYKNTMDTYKVKADVQVPPFLTNKHFVDMHKSRLLFKDEAFYRSYCWNVKPSSGGYYWYENGIYTIRSNGLFAVFDLSKEKPIQTSSWKRVGTMDGKGCKREIRRGKYKGERCDMEVKYRGYCKKCMKLKSVMRTF